MVILILLYHTGSMVAANSLDTHNDRVGPLPITVPQVHVDPVHRRGRRGALQPFGLP